MSRSSSRPPIFNAPTVLVCLLLLASQAFSGQRSPASEKPNILILLADDQRTDTIGAYGNDQIQTPHLDQLVRGGFSFRQNYCLGSIHGAVCQPSRAMLLSGRTLYRVPMDLQNVPTLPEQFARHGYRTFMTGKWHNGAESLTRIFPQAKAVFLGGMCDHTRVPLRDVKDGQLQNERTGSKFSSELFADAAIDLLADAARHPDQPFFAYVAFTAPHDPRQPPLAYREAYYRRSLSLPKNFLPQHPFANGWLIGRDEQLASWPRRVEDIRDQLAEYYGMITHLDEQVGRILTALSDYQLQDNTLVIYAADHGLAMGSHGLLGKQSLYEHSTRCPLVIRGPGVPEDDESQALTYLLDLFPTLCDAANVPRPDGLEGESLMPIWKGEKSQVRPTLFTAYEGFMRAMRDERWKLIRYPHLHYNQLFDLLNDPDEMVNLAERPEQAQRVEQMLTQLAEWQERVGDTQPLTNPQRQAMEVDLSRQPRRADEWQPEWIRRKYFP